MKEQKKIERNRVLEFRSKKRQLNAQDEEKYDLFNS